MLCTKPVPRSHVLATALDMALELLGIGSAGLPEHIAELSRRARPDVSDVGRPPQNGVLPADVPPQHSEWHSGWQLWQQVRARLLRCRYFHWPGFLRHRGNNSE